MLTLQMSSVLTLAAKCVLSAKSSKNDIEKRFSRAKLSQAIMDNLETLPLCHIFLGVSALPFRDTYRQLWPRVVIK
ncbi:hypothetical protein F5890DRAFT_1161812 [Lentinula detonsa]|uniref:HAT C-terminal dimerisation domain-containing protein n=1 Tax=Lentinula detonsa TaxID=2804962 RepID=A0AA38PNK5_9AGAR|nr:hypothetical protein F5890DRAFT_1161812 [Lentinula detonsa]